MPVILYKFDASPPCRAVNMVVDLIGLQVDVKTVNINNGEQLAPEFVEKNPLHSIPLIEDGDFILCDSHAIITFLVSKYGADKRAKLYPSDLRIRATVDQRLFFDDSVLFPRLRDIFTAVLKQKKAGTEQQLAPIGEAYGFLEKYLEKSPFLAAEHLTLADVACVATVSSLDMFLPVDEKYPQLLEWFKNIKETDWYKNGNEPGLSMVSQFFKSYISGA